ncbi:MAG TPA: aminotransferase class I/II-fold pyridoxal phosphate-dependent enzyme, partial [Candidatus Methylacidiphilales bacterium]|nr:aminotransferase class I/II-fold pyridoxal phosphate-dependent enzyme [Candidatus Methylacidiphilales bacterium]
MMIPYARQSISEDDIAAVTRVLRSDFLTQGPEVSAFEAEMAETVGAGYGVALSSATAGLHLACLALGLKPGDWLWTSPITFVASANCARYCGAHVDFVDIDPRTYNLCPVALASRLEEGEKTGRLPKIVVAVHLAGQSCEMEKIHALGRRYGFRIIEDAAHAVGADYQGRPVGACMYSDCTVFSFHPVKIMTTGEGGMVLTQDGELAARIRRMSTHGITRQADLLTQNDGPWYYEQLELGYHYRLTDIQAALGRSQLKRLPDFIRRRRELARRY